ncbi:putative integral outer membrane protein [Flavobacterium limnosediminis JC2902]|uniref:Putative integral outer membrane protein n=1 Tax=Flavobacterium limnosediminis JC2902 TaxID=1341181 RepID=V6SHV2_9FLAO|nr:TonB-dependent receptor [Flavobacterium limnosediminis]ESU25847.1 putative integral outer membrane protein [Flavobacterium limnosediminis JC2902]
MNQTFKYITAITFLLTGMKTFAQKKDENIGTEVVNVVKPYTPTISDAFKVKETPVIDDETNAQKEEIKYNIFSFPVASTFTPAKGRAADVDKAAKERLFKNYATLGVGNYGTVNAELFVTEDLSNNDYVGGMLRHLSSQGGINDVVLDDDYYNTAFDVTYGSRTREVDWNADLGYKHQMYNWYGLPTEFVTFTEDAINAIDEQQTYQTVTLGAKVGVKEGLMNETSMQFKRFWDSHGSEENRFFIKPGFDFEVENYKFKADIVADYVGGSFEKDYFEISDISYSYLNFGVVPAILLQKDDLSVEAGAGFFYSRGVINDETDGKFYIFPQIKASYKLVGDIMIAYAGAEGNLKQNSFADFVEENKFVSPTLGIAPTNQQYDIYVGLKGKLANTVAFNVRGSYMAEEDKAFFTANPFVTVFVNDAYEYGNSFGVVYDKLKTVSFFGELKMDFSKNVAFGVNGTFNSYTTDQREAWNLPGLKIGADLDVDITKKWYAGADVFFVGDRKDYFYYSDITLSEPLSKTVTLDSYFDLNAHLGYKHSERLTGFLKLNNIANQQYERWMNYPVQGFQFLLGANYKFDF